MNPQHPPFLLLSRPDGRHELRAFSDDSDDPIVLVLNDEEGRELRRAVADVLGGVRSGLEHNTTHLVIDGRDVEIVGSSDGGLRLTVAR